MLNVMEQNGATFIPLADISEESHRAEGSEHSTSDNFDDDEAAQTSYDRIQQDGAAEFKKLQSQIISLDRTLCHLATARQLASSVAILSASVSLRKDLSRLLTLFRDNAAQLFPKYVSSQAQMKSLSRLRSNSLKPGMEDLQKTTSNRSDLSANTEFSSLPDCMVLFAENVARLKSGLNEHTEFTDESLDEILDKVNADFFFWSSSLRTHRGQIYDHNVRRYVHRLSGDIGQHLKDATAALDVFITLGIPTIRYAQRHATENLLNLSTVSTFFSAVTATTLQFSYMLTNTPLSNSVNAFWFTSLVFSVGAAVNSVLGVSWKLAGYRSPRHKVPSLVLLWVNHSPLVFLVISIACFCVGLVLFAWSTHQHIVTSCLTTIFTAFSCMGSAGVATWFAFERLVFTRYQGQKWLADVLEDAHITNGLRWLLCVPRGLVRAVRHSSCFGGKAPRIVIDDGSGENSKSSHAVVPMNGHEAHSAESGDAGDAATTQQAQSAVATRSGQRRKSILGRTESDSSVFVHASVRLPEERRKLTALKKQDLSPHKQGVRVLQFSPDGTVLASGDSTTTIALHQLTNTTASKAPILTHDHRVKQLIWSPDGETVLVRTAHGLHTWTKAGNLMMSVSLDGLKTVAWLPDGEAFIAVECQPRGSYIREYDLSGVERRNYFLPEILLRHTVVLHNGRYILGIGSVIPSEELQPSSWNKSAQQIILYSLTHPGGYKLRYPVHGDVHDVTRASLRLNDLILLSYRGKTPPELFEVQTEDNSPSLTSQRHYLLEDTAETPEYSGRSCFGGRKDRLVISFTVRGDIHIWDRDTARKLYTIDERSTQPLGASLTCLAWNSGLSKSFMLATGRTDGAVSIWATPRMSDSVEKADEDGNQGLDLASLIQAFRSGGFVATIPSMRSPPVFVIPSDAIVGVSEPSLRSGYFEEVPPESLEAVADQDGSTHSDELIFSPEDDLSETGRAP